MESFPSAVIAVEKLLEKFHFQGSGITEKNQPHISGCRHYPHSRELRPETWFQIIFLLPS